MKRSARTKVVWLVLSLVFTLTLASAASAQALKPLADGFPKRAITLIVVDDPGTREDIYAKTLQKALRGISPVPILVSCEPVATGGTWVKVKELPTREGGKDGYYIIVISTFGVVTDLMSEPYTRDVGAKLSDLSMVMVTEAVPHCMTQRKNAPWGPTFAGMVKYGKENPGKLRYISVGVGSTHDIECSWLLSVLGVKVKKIPAGGEVEALPIVGAGQGDFTLTSIDYASPHIEAGRVTPTMFLGDVVPAPWNKDPNIVSAEQAGLPKTNIIGEVVGLGGPSQIPKAHIDWLNELFKASVSTDAYKQRAKTVPALSVMMIDAAQADQDNKKIYEDCDPIIRAAGLHIDQRKKK
jgi:tripartite-type tricarboxylate transporter receptor subunit TctC